MAENVYGVRRNKCLTPINGEINNITVGTSGWASATINGQAVFKKTIAIPALKEKYGPLYMGTDWAHCTGTVKDTAKSKDQIYNFEYGDGTLVLYAKKIPSTEIKIKLSGIGLEGGA